MLDEIKKSLQSVLYERVSSPLSGAFGLSWGAWNWKFLYYIYADGSELTLEKKIISACGMLNWHNSLLYPFLSAIFLITIYPAIATLALYISLKYKKLQNDIKNKIEDQKLLNVKQSNELRIEMANQENRIERLIKNRDERIGQLEKEKEMLLANESERINELSKERMAIIAQNEELQKDLMMRSNEVKKLNEDSEKYNLIIAELEATGKTARNDKEKHLAEIRSLRTEKEELKFLNDALEKKTRDFNSFEEDYRGFMRNVDPAEFRNILRAIEQNGILGNNFSPDVITYFVVNEVIAKDLKNYTYHLTAKGKKFAKKFLDGNA